MEERYRILREIGRGAMGRVYLAHDTLLERDVALKELSVPDYLSDEEKAEVRERFRQEAKAAARLTHPHILTVHDIILSGDRQFIVMEYLEGKTMREVLTERRLSPEEVMSIAPMVCEALGYAHRQGIVHRDVKPDNIFVLQNGNIKVADFGIAKMIRVSDRTHTDVIMGTPNYIAPEVILGRPYDYRVDIFALGVTMYEMLSGQRPFDAENDFAIIYRVATEEPRSLSELVEGLPPTLERAVHRALQKEPSLRYGSMDELKADLMKVRSELGMESGEKEPFDKKRALMSELEAAREVRLDLDAPGGGYDFRRDRGWKELISRIYSDHPLEESGSGKAEAVTAAVGTAAAEAGPRTYLPVYDNYSSREDLSRSGKGESAAGSEVRARPFTAAALHEDPLARGQWVADSGEFAFPGRARRLAFYIPALAALLVVSTLFPWIGKALNPLRSMAGISFPEGMLFSGLATLVAGCDALLALGMVQPKKWVGAMRVMSLLALLTVMVFLGLRVIAGLGYHRAPGLSPGQALAGTGWGLWLALAGSAVFYSLCS
uniref:serine/threonine-protein kinase n=1 Tax=Candidatus Solincola tengchongensis TaxID=2900693 RepID=UPI00257C4850